jgi:hypothetical protein
MKSIKLADKPAERGRPLWGFCRVKVHAICRLWSAYRDGTIARQDVQTWFGVHELLTRRCTVAASRHPSFSESELGTLTGQRAPGVRASLRRLECSGFLTWASHHIRLLDDAEPPAASLAAMLAVIPNQNRTVPIPRHTVLLLARTRRPVLLATVLGHLLRGMYYRSRECVSWGTCKASFIADAFGVDVRNVKAARRELVRTGWLRQVPSLHWHRQRFGGSFVVSLAWAHSAPSERRKSPPRRRYSTPKSPPPESYRNLPSELKHQNRGTPMETGVFKDRNANQGTPNAPTWRHLERNDLTDPTRLLTLYEHASRTGAVASTEMDRLHVFTAAEHALAIGTRNPCGLFVHLVKNRLWKFSTERDEDLARQKLRRMLHGGETPLPDVTPQPRAPEPLSNDARLALAIHAASVQQRIPALVFVRRMRPDWTLERYEHVLNDAQTKRRSRYLPVHHAA